MTNILEKKLSKEEQKMLQDLDRLQSNLLSESPSITRSNIIKTGNKNKKMVSFRSNDNKSLYVLIFGIFGIIAIIYISLATTISTSFIPTSSNERHLLTDREQAAQATITRLLAATKDDPVKNRALGALLLGAISDALGAPLEFYFGFKRVQVVSGNINGKVLVGRFIGGVNAEGFGTYLVKDHASIKDSKTWDTWEIYDGAKNGYHQAVTKAMNTSGGGFYNLAPWQTTDDTAMAIQMTRGIIAADAKKGDAPVSIKDIQQEIANKYWEWANPNPTGDIKVDGKAVVNQPFDIGFTIKEILQTEGLKQNLNDLQEPVNVQKLLEKSKEKNADTLKRFKTPTWSNGALMRIIPMAVYCRHLSDDKVFQVVKADVELTNNNEASAKLVTTYVLIMKELINGKTTDQALDYAEEYLMKPLRQFQEKPVKIPLELDEGNQKPSAVLLKWIQTFREKGEPKTEGCRNTDAPPPFCNLGNDFSIGLIDLAFKQTIQYLSQFKKPQDFVTSITEILKGGGDTDTNAAIVGAMLGAKLGFHGIHNLPNEQGKKWLIGLLSVDVMKHRHVYNQGANEVESDFNPYLARRYIDDDLWSQLFEIAPKDEQIVE